MQPKALGIITARGGSKSIIRKNIKELRGKPLIAWTIEAAKKSGVFDRIILSTDDGEISRLGKNYGVDVPFMRPAKLAQDAVPTLPVIQHAVTWLKDNENYEANYASILQPTAPLRQDWHLKEAFELLQKSNADSVVGVSPVPGEYNPYWQFFVEPDGGLKLFTGEPLSNIIERRQEQPVTYTRNGAIYIFKKETLFGQTPLYGDKSLGYVMEPKYSVNIDTLEDWYRAEIHLREFNL
jgi:CMP-N,N'-diacetyllegionaminic acid synthase